MNAVENLVKIGVIKSNSMNVSISEYDDFASEKISGYDEYNDYCESAYVDCVIGIFAKVEDNSRLEIHIPEVKVTGRLEFSEESVVGFNRTFTDIRTNLSKDAKMTDLSVDDIDIFVDSNYVEISLF